MEENPYESPREGRDSSSSSDIEEYAWIIDKLLLVGCAFLVLLVLWLILSWYMYAAWAHNHPGIVKDLREAGEIIRE